MAELRNGVWRCNFRYVDPTTGVPTRCRQSLGRLAGKREAEKAEADLRYKLEHPAPPAPVAEATTTKRAAFSGFAAKWLEMHVATNCKANYYRTSEQYLRVHAVPFFGDRLLTDIEPEHIAEFKAALVAKKLRPKTVNNALGVIGRMYTDAIEWGYAKTNPVRRVKPLKVATPEIRFWVHEQSEAFLAAARRMRSAWYPFFLMALRTGMRLGELCALRWQDVDFALKQVRVVQNWTNGVLEETPKSGKARVLDLADDVIAALKAHRHLLGELVFPNHDGGYLSPTQIKKPYLAVMKAAGVPRIRFHDLRHTFASQLVIKGVPLKAVQELLGHADIKMTMRYAHLAPGKTREYVNLLTTDATLAPAVEGATKSGPNLAPWRRGQLQEVGPT
jgi:integrase